MKIIAINGSPRRSWNTATLLQKALDGAASKGAQTEMIHLYDLDFRGCISCYSCKQMGNRHCCVLHDDLSRMLEKMSKADGLIFGSPIFFGTITSGMSACLERFLFPYIIYGNGNLKTYEQKMPSAFILAMDALDEQLDNEHDYLGNYANVIKKVLGEETQTLCFNDAEQLASCGTCQKTECNMVTRNSVREDYFPVECQKAYQLGASVAERALNNQRG